MNRAEVAQVLALLATNWPAEEIPAETAELWRVDLAACKAEYAGPATQHVIRTHRGRFPPVGVWRQAYQECARARALERRPELPDSPRTEREEAIENIRQLRRIVNKEVEV